MHPVTDETVTAFAKWLGQRETPEHRKRAESLVNAAVENALNAGPAALDTIKPVELERIARARYRERVQAGEAAGLVVSGGSGLPLSPGRGARGSSS